MTDQGTPDKWGFINGERQNADGTVTLQGSKLDERCPKCGENLRYWNEAENEYTYCMNGDYERKGVRY